jgi:hypothetical protein
VSLPKPTHRPRVLWSLCALAVVLPALIVWAGRHGREGPPAVTEVSVPADWAMADLLRKLGPLGLRVVPANRTGLLEDGVFLTATGLGWEELSTLHKAAVPGEGALGAWRGTVFVQASRSRPDTQPLEVGKRSALHAGRFHFYGDPELLDRIEAALGE